MLIKIMFINYNNISKYSTFIHMYILLSLITRLDKITKNSLEKNLNGKNDLCII